MNLTEEQLQLIGEYASNLMTWREIAILLGIPYKALLEEFLDEGSPATLSYQKGKTQTLLEIRRSIIGMAKKGSPQAEITAMSLIDHQKVNETDIL